MTLFRVDGATTRRFVYEASEIGLGFTEPPKGSAVFLDSTYGLLCSAPPAKPGEKPRLRSRMVFEPTSEPTCVISRDGMIFFARHVGRLFGQ